MPLTVKQVQNAKAGRHSDGRGLYLLVKPSGSKSWVLRVQFRGERKDWGLGSVSLDPVDVDLPLHRRSSLTLAEAREKARIGRELAKTGVNPSVHWRVEPAPTIPTFKEVAERYHKEVKGGWRNGKHAKQWLSTLENYVFPALGNFRVDLIDAASLQKILLPIWLLKPETARRVKQRMLAVLDYSHAQGWRSTEAPARALNQLLTGIKQPKGGNFPAIPYRSLPDFVAKLREADWTMGRAALLFVILTAARSGEVRGATWGEINLEAAEWRIPGGRMKAGRPHIVPLVPAAVELLKTIQSVYPHGEADLVFPGNRGRMMSDATMAKVLRNTEGGEGCTVHGLRSTFTDWAAESGFADAWAQAAKAHRNPDKTEAAYKRTTYFEHRRDKLMPAWASFALNDQSNVVSLIEKVA